MTVLATSDPIKMPYNHPSGQATVCGAPWSLFFSLTGWTSRDVWIDEKAEEDGIWTAKLFCVGTESYDGPLGGSVTIHRDGDGVVAEREVACLVLTWLQHLSWYHTHLLASGSYPD